MVEKLSANTNNTHDPYPLANTEAGKKLNDTVVDKTGFEPADMLEAPVKKPELKNTRPNLSLTQYMSVGLGAIMAVLGLVLVSYADYALYGVMFIIIGAFCVALGTLVRL